ncbi:glycosyltransferase family 1 protein [ANME-2 cluster archaeon]|nr:MAG: glycosyltransferase family 1 protein [ANME-2 cluster archaeon]
MESLRIGMFAWESMHSVKVGGIAPHVTNLSEILAGENEVHIFTRIGDRSEYEEINGVHYERCAHDQSGGIVDQMNAMCRAMVDRFYAVEDLFGRFDIIHGHDWHPVLALSEIKRRSGTPFVITYHSTEWGRNGNAHSDSWESREISHREWLAGYESSRVITTSKRMWTEIRNLYQIPDEKIEIVGNGVLECQKRDIDPGRVKERYGIHPLAPVVLFVGRMVHQKGVDLLIEAIPHILAHRWDVMFIFAGEGGSRQRYEELARELGVYQSCRFLGYVSEDVREELMNVCDLLCVPSRNEPFGIVVLEGWSVEKPVVGTFAVDVIDNFKDGIKAYLYPESIAWCINYMLDNPDLMKEMGENGKNKVEQFYTWDYIAKKTFDVYEKVLRNTDLETY